MEMVVEKTGIRERVELCKTCSTQVMIENKRGQNGPDTVDFRQFLLLATGTDFPAFGGFILK